MTSSIGNKEILAKNLTHYIEKTGRTQREICEFVGVATSTLNDWVKGKKYPRIDKIEMLADFFGIMKSDLIEDHEEMQKNNDIMSDVIIRMRTDPDFFLMVKTLDELDSEKFAVVKSMLTGLSK